MSEIWQYPYVDIFKCFNLWDWKNSKKAGEVVEGLDSTIGRKILTITGSIPSNNYISIPKLQAEMKTLALKGRYIYLCLCGSKLPFATHFEFSAPITVRISLSNMFKEETYDKMTIHIPIQLTDNRWTIICLDVKGLMKRHGIIKDYNEKILLKALTVCSNIKISKIVTSDKLYDYSTFPKDLGFKFVHYKDWSAKYDWLEPFPRPKSATTKSPKKRETPPKKPLQPKKEKTPIEIGKSEKEQLEEQARYTLIKARSEEAKAKFLMKMTGKENVLAEDSLRASTRLVKMEKDALIQLNTVLGATIDRCPNICWGKMSDSKEIVYAAGSIIIAMNAQNEKQRLFKGYKSSIRALCLNADGSRLAAADSDMIRLWNYETTKCLGTWKAEGYSTLSNLSFSPDATLLATSGLDSHGRDMLTVWDLNTLNQISTYQPHPKIYARQLSPYQIQCLRFGPSIFEDGNEMQLCSCGKENIKFWKLKKQMLKGILVRLNQYAQKSFFTCLEYENQIKVYIGSKEGRILQVNAETQELEFVYQLHDAGITSLAICETFCVTGSDNMYLHVWPLDFSEFFMEAKHESLIRSVAISPDSIEILCATENSTIGVLDIPNQKYKTIIRSHTGDILSADILKNLVVTISIDKTIRVWDLNTMQQIYEFSSPDDQATCVAIHIGLLQFVCGFNSGTIRVFDLNKTIVTDESQASTKSIVTLRYLHKAELLIAIAEDGGLAFFASHSHQLIKQVNPDFSSVYTGLGVLRSEHVFATIGENATSIQVWDSASLGKILTIPILGCQVRDVAIRSEGLHILAVTTDSQLRVFSIDGKPLGKFSLPNTDLGPLRKTVKLLVTQNGKYAALYGFSNAILQFPLQPITPDPSASLSQSQLLPGLEIEEYSYHTSPVNVALYHPDDPTMFFSAGNSEGIFMWNFQGNTAPAAEEGLPEEFNQLLRKAVPLTTTKRLGFRRKEDEEDKEEVEIKEEKVIEERTFINIQQNIRMDATIALKSQVEEEKIDSKSVSQLLLSKAGEIIAKKRGLNLSNRQYISCESEEIIKNPYMDEGKIVTPVIIVGYNGYCHDNIVWNETAGWAAYTVRNKLIVEEVLNKEQEIYVNHDTEISSIALSMDNQMFATASSKRTNIILYNVSEVKPKLKLNKQFTSNEGGIFLIRFVGGHKFICSISAYPKTTIMIWNCSLGTCVASETLKHPINDLKVNLNDETYQSFATIGVNELYIWKIKPGVKARLTKKLTTTETKGFSCLVQTPFIESEGNRLFVIGTTVGTILLYNTRNKNFLGEYPIFEGEITCMSVHNDALIVGGTSNKLLKWDKIDLVQPNALKKEPQVMLLDSNVTSICMDKKGNEGQIGTDVGSVWYVNWEEKKTIKIHAGHLGSNIKAMGTSAYDAFFASVAEDNMIKVWTKDKCDELETTELPNILINTVAIHKDLCILGSNEGYVRYFSLKDFKCLGKVKLCKGEITAMTMSITNESAFVGDSLGSLCLIGVDTLKPLSVKSKELLNLQKSITGIDVQQVRDKSRFLVALGDGSVKIWERVTPSEKKEPFTLSSSWEFTEIDSFAFSEEDDRKPSRTFAIFNKKASLVIGCTEIFKEIIVRDIRKKENIKSVELLQSPLCLAFIDSKNFAIVGGLEGILEVIDLNSGKMNTARVHGGKIEAICAKGGEVFSASYGEIIKWKIA